MKIIIRELKMKIVIEFKDCKNIKEASNAKTNHR